MNTNYISLEFDVIIEKLKEHALSGQAKKSLDTLSPYLNEAVCARKMRETTAARRLLEGLGSPPLALMKNLDEMMALAAAGGMLVPEQLGEMVLFASACRRMGTYLARGEGLDTTVAVYGRSIEDLSGLQIEIERCVAGDRLHDEASPALKNTRRKMDHVEGQMKEKLSHILQSRKQYLADGYITTRQGHYVLPVQRKYQAQFGGTVIEMSGKGGTVFMEPATVAKLQAERTALAIEEDAEVRRILYELTALVARQAPLIHRNSQAMELLDVLFAKAKLSVAMGAGPVTVNGGRRLDIRQGRHPLLDAEACVPLDFLLDEGTLGVVITGPNTGGKTVAVKTVGLLSLMAQCGLHIPCGANSTIAMQDGYWCDIGDSQNITQNLSTFSGHITNVIHILENASSESLVLLDELGSGTDPAEGMGLAVAVLEELRVRGCQFLATTHYPQVKAYAEKTPGVLSARMAFDRETLAPLYRLEMGKSGESCALHIARRLGLAPHLLARAHLEVYGVPGAECAPGRPAMPAPKGCLVRTAPQKDTVDPAAKFSMGDSVTLLPGGETGIVYRPADKNGDVVVQVKDEKRTVKHNRLQLQVLAAELYPPDYDFSIIFDTAEHRRARKQMGKHHSPGISITHTE